MFFKAQKIKKNRILLKINAVSISFDFEEVLALMQNRILT